MEQKKPSEAWRCVGKVSRYAAFIAPIALLCLFGIPWAVEEVIKPFIGDALGCHRITWERVALVSVVVLGVAVVFVALIQAVVRYFQND